MYRVKLSIHSLPDSLNKGLRTNRFKYNSKNKKWDFLILGIIRNKLPPQPLEKAHISIVRHFYRTLDFDGLVGSMKPVVDALVSAGLIKDDSWNCVGPWTIDQKFRPKSEGPLLEIFVEEIV